MTSWLNKQKKQQLLDLSTQAGLPQSSDLRRDELIDKLDSYLQTNATRLSTTTAFEPYYGTRRTPFKPRSSSAAGGLTSDDGGEVKSVVKARGRKTTTVKSETDEEGPSASPVQALIAKATALTSRTPGRSRARELPASPADVADDMEYAARRMSAGIDELYTSSHIPDLIASVRDSCSSITGVQTTALLIESIALIQKLIPRYPFPNPPLTNPTHFLGLPVPGLAFPLPDLFQLLTAHFWIPVLLWASTSLILPLVFAYFYNLSIRDIKRQGTRLSHARYPIDPMVFNIVKGVVSYVVYRNAYTVDLVDPYYIETVNAAMPGGCWVPIVGSGVGVLASLYEAVQRK